MTTPIPPATAENVLPPNLDHDYFAVRVRHPFEPAAAAYSAANAWWLAEAALLAYADEDFVADRLAAAGFPAVPGGVVFGESTRCYVAASEAAVLVAFRGTEVLKAGTGRDPEAAVRGVLADVLADAACGLVAWDGPGRVHCGFLAALDEVWGERLSPLLDALARDRPGRPVWFAGHSLGAALATLAAARHPAVRAVYAFGSPAAGDGAFARGFRPAAYRVVNNSDVVPWVPPQALVLPGLAAALPELPLAGFYAHVGRLKHVDADGRLLDAPTLAARLSDGVAGRLGHVAAAVRNLRDGVIGELPDDAFNDHAPLFYALRLRSLLAEG